MDSDAASAKDEQTSSDESKAESPSEEQTEPSTSDESTEDSRRRKDSSASDSKKHNEDAKTKAADATDKIEIRLQAVGDAPIMKQKNYKVDGVKQINWIIAFIRKYLKLEEQDSLYLYVNQAFSPSPDQTVTNLNKCFGSEGKLVLYYSKSQAWG